MTAGYAEIEARLNAAKSRFSEAWESVENARIVKTQRNGFALRFKYPLLISFCLLVIAAVFVVQFVFAQFDALYIVCECIIVLAMAVGIFVLSVSWFWNVRNAKCAEVIDYLRSEPKCVVSEIAGGGMKVEWEEARFYFRGDQAELFEGGVKEYRPFVYKKMRGHSRNYALLDLEALTANFFDGATVVSEENDTTALSSGFRFHLSDGKLDWFEIEGMYSECYENNLPIFALFGASKSYVFRYAFTELNRKHYRMVLPDIVRDACKYYFLEEPRGEGVVIANPRVRGL